MRKEYGKVKAFRMDKDDEKLLNECFEMLNITADSFNAKMTYFIGRVHKDLEELSDLRKRVTDQQNQIRELKNKVPPSPPMEQPTKSETPTPSKPLQKPLVYDPKEHRQLEKKTMPRWICVREIPRHPNPEMQEARCDTCKARHWSEWKACQELKLEA